MTGDWFEQYGISNTLSRWDAHLYQMRGVLAQQFEDPFEDPNGSGSGVPLEGRNGSASGLPFEDHSGSASCVPLKITVDQVVVFTMDQHHKGVVMIPMDGRTVRP